MTAKLFCRQWLSFFCVDISNNYSSGELSVC